MSQQHCTYPCCTGRGFSRAHNACQYTAPITAPPRQPSVEDGDSTTESGSSTETEHSAPRRVVIGPPPPRPESSAMITIRLDDGTLRNIAVQWLPRAQYPVAPDSNLRHHAATYPDDVVARARAKPSLLRSPLVVVRSPADREGRREGPSVEDRGESGPRRAEMLSSGRRRQEMQHHALGYGDQGLTVEDRVESGSERVRMRRRDQPLQHHSRPYEDIDCSRHPGTPLERDTRPSCRDQAFEEQALARTRVLREVERVGRLKRRREDDNEDEEM